MICMTTKRKVACSAPEPASSRSRVQPPRRMSERLHAEDLLDLDSLPSVILDIIFSYLEVVDLANTSTVSRNWSKFSSRDKLWRPLILEAWSSLGDVLTEIESGLGWPLKDFYSQRLNAHRQPAAGSFKPNFLQCELRQQKTMRSLGSLTLPLDDASLIKLAFGDSMLMPGVSFMGVPSDLQGYEDLEGCDLELTLIDTERRAVRLARINRSYQTFLSPIPYDDTDPDGLMLVQLRSWRHTGTFGWLSEPTHRAATSLEPVLNVTWEHGRAKQKGQMSTPGSPLRVSLRIETWHIILGELVPLDNMHTCDTLRLVDRMIEAVEWA